MTADEIKKLKEELEHQKALADLAEQQKKRIEAERALEAAQNPAEADSAESIARYSRYQKELTAFKNLLPGQDTKWTGATMSLQKGAYIDNELDGAALAESIATELVKGGLGAASDKNLLVVNPAWLLVSEQYSSIRTRLTAFGKSFDQIQKEGEKIHPELKVGALGLPAIGAAIGGFDALLKGAASISAAFQISREILDPIALASFSSSFEAALLSKLRTGNREVEVPQFSALRRYDPNANSDLLKALQETQSKREAARASLGAATQRVSDAEENSKELKDKLDKASAEEKSKLEKQLADLAAGLTQSHESSKGLESQLELFSRLSTELEATLVASAGDLSILDRLLIWEQARSRCSTAACAIVLIRVEIAGARNEITKRPFRSPRWNTRTGAVVTAVVADNDGKLTSVWTTRKDLLAAH